MIRNTKTPANVGKVAQVETAMAELMAQSLKRGFFGNVAVEFSVQDGTIQSIRRTLTQMEK